MIGGTYSRLISENWIKITLKNGQEEEYPKIISDDDFFVYFENKNRKNEWESIRKEDIQKMECIRHKSRFSEMFNLMKEEIRIMWENHKYFSLGSYLFVKFFIIILMIILLIPLIFH